MKQYIYLLFLTLGVLGCKKKESQEVAPTLSLKNEAGYVTSAVSVNGDTTLKMGVTGMLGDGTQFKSVKVTRRYDFGNWEIVVDSSIATDTLDFDYTITPRNFLGEEQWSISGVDDLGLISSATVRISTKNIERKGIKIYDVCREQENAYDLLNDVSLDIALTDNAVPDSLELDMVNNLTCNDSLFLGWYATASSQTRFVLLDTTLLYETVLQKDIVEAFELQQSYTNSSKARENELYGASVRDGEAYAVIEITKVVVDTLNESYVQFKYKK